MSIASNIHEGCCAPRALLQNHKVTVSVLHHIGSSKRVHGYSQTVEGYISKWQEIKYLPIIGYRQMYVKDGVPTI